MNLEIYGERRKRGELLLESPTLQRSTLLTVWHIKHLEKKKNSVGYDKIFPQFAFRERNIAPRGTVAEQSFNTGGQDGEGEGESSGVMGMDPDVLAQTYWSLHVQDQRAWTQELDIRPSNTRF